MNAMTIANTNCPAYFFGMPMAAIKTEADAIAAIKQFCEAAPIEVVEATTEELKALAEINHDFYQVINSLLWKTELQLGSYGWNNRFKMLNASLK